MLRGKNVLAIPDLHGPFQHKDAIPFLLAVSQEYQCNEVICLGDEVDHHALSRFPKDPDGMSAGGEFTKAYFFMQELFGAFPAVKSCLSNHTSRPFRMALEHGIPKALLKSYGEAFDAPEGWQWALRWEIDGIVYEHGEGVSGQGGALKAALQNMKPTVIGHLHGFAGIQYQASYHTVIWGMNTGCLIDVEAYAFKYGEKFRNKVNLGCGVIRDGVPLWQPMRTKRGRWDGTL